MESPNRVNHISLLKVLGMYISTITTTSHICDKYDKYDTEDAL